MRGAGETPRGPRAHQKTLRQHDRHCMLTHHQIWPRSPKMKRPSTQEARRSGPIHRKPPSQHNRPTPGRESQEQASRRPIRLTNKFSSSHQIWPRKKKKSPLRSPIKASGRPPAAIGRRLAARAKEQASRRPIRLMNKFSSSHQIWPRKKKKSPLRPPIKASGRPPAATTLSAAIASAHGH